MKIKEGKYEENTTIDTKVSKNIGNKMKKKLKIRLNSYSYNFL